MNILPLTLKMVTLEGGRGVAGHHFLGFPLSVVSPHKCPGDQHSTKARRKYSNGANVAHAIRGPKLGLIDLWTHDTHELTTCVGEADGKPSRRGASCCTNPFRPDDGKKRLGCCRGDHHEDVLCYGLLNRNKQNVAYNLNDLDANPCSPR